MNALTPLEQTRQNQIIIGDTANKDSVSRLKRYSEYLEAHGMDWWKPDLATYRDRLLAEGLSENSVSAHLSTVRSRYRAIVRQRDLFYAMLPDMTTVEAKTLVDEIVARIENAIHPDEAKVDRITVQDHIDNEHVWLTSDDVRRLIEQPFVVYGDESPIAFRDSALLYLLTATGVRESEAVALDVSDLYQSVNGERVLLVRRGKGNKQRVIPYGDSGVLDFIDYWWLSWLETQTDLAGDTPLFWSFWKDGRSLRGRLSARRVGELVRSHYLDNGGELLTVSPHDLRRTYARLQYQAGMSPLSISQNMGHTSLELTIRHYIGILDVSERLSKSAF